MSTQQKSHRFRKTGMKTKFTHTDDLDKFKTTLWDHFRDTGLDTITYIVDPMDTMDTVSVVKNHARLSPPKAEADLLHTKFDMYDQQNNRAARAYLLDSIDDRLKRQLRYHCKETQPFSVWYMHFIRFVRNRSLDSFDRVKKRIKDRKVSSYPGENLEDMAIDYMNDAEELEVASHYEHRLTLTMLEEFMKAGGSSNEDFRFDLRTVRKDLKELLQEAPYLTKTEADRRFIDNELTYRDICRKVTDLYRAQLDDGKWPPAKSNPDTKTAPTAFGNTATPAPKSSSDTTTSALVAKLC